MSDYEKMMKELENYKPSPEIQRIAEMLLDESARFVNEVAEKELEASYLLMLNQAISENITFRQAIEKYYVKRSDVGHGTEYTRDSYGRMLLGTARDVYDVKFELCKRKFPIVLDNYDIIACDTIKFLCNKLGKDFRYDV